MPRRASNAELPPAPPKKPSSLLGVIRTAFRVAVMVCVAVGCVWAAVKIEQYVVSDAEFLLQGPPEPGIPSAHFEVTGIEHASEQKIINVFARDFGRSIYLCPIEERRRKLLAIDWVRDAHVLRIWPSRIVVRIIERTPVAAVQIPGVDGAELLSLIDAEGVLLDPPHSAKFALPVLTGFPAHAPEAVRRERIQRFLRLQTELAEYMDKISEIDVSDTDNFKLIQEIEGRALTLMVGNQKFHTRYKNFLDNFEEIRKRLPGATTLDLRLKDRITAVGQPEEEARR